MNRNKARARVMSERTGKPHFYVYNGVKVTEWLWEGPDSDAVYAFCDHMDRVYGYDTVEVHR